MAITNYINKTFINKSMGSMKYLLICMLLVFTMSFISAEITQQQNTVLKFSMTSNFADNCTLTTINTPTDVLFVNQNGSKTSQTFNFTINGGNFTELGEHRLNIECADTTDKITEYETVSVTPTGEMTNGWKISLQLFVSISCLILMFLFLTMANSNIKQQHISQEEKPGIVMFFMGIAFIFLFAHLIITNVIIHDTMGVGALSGAYTNVMTVFFWIVTAIAIFSLAKIGFNVVSMLQKGRGLK